MNKKRTSYNIEISVLNEFDKIASKTAFNKSRLIELLIRDWISKQKKNKNG